MKWLRLLLLVTLPATSFAQGTFLFTWHGQSNYFQASFIVTAAEMQPGSTFSSPEFTNSVQISSLSGINYNAKDDASLFGGGVNPWGFHITFVDFNRGMEVIAGAGQPPRGAMAGSIEEKPMFGQELYFETGYWSYAAIPEPSIIAISILGGGILFLRRRAAHR
jgi:hypothetical protein